MNTFEIILSVIFGVTMMTGLIAGVRWYYRKSKREITALGFVFHAKCEMCGAEYPVSTEEFLRRKGQKSKTKTKAKIVGGAVVNEPQYTYIAKKLECPSCQETRWAEILNFNEYQVKSRGIVFTNALIVFGVLFVMSQVIMLVGSIALKIASLF